MDRISRVTGCPSLVSMCKAARIIGVHPASVRRWCLKGRDGVKLRTHRVDGKLMVSIEDVVAFREWPGLHYEHKLPDGEFVTIRL